MSDAHLIIIPLLNSNEPEALIADLPIVEGQYVTQGDTLCTIETTKSTSELTAETAGYVVGLGVKLGEMVRAGQSLCYLAGTPDWQPPDKMAAQPDTSAPAGIPDGLRITQPALALASTQKVDLSQLPLGPLVTKSLVEAFLLDNQDSPSEDPFDPTTIVVYGGGGHGESVIDMIRALATYRLVGIIDDGLPEGTLVLDTPVLGGGALLRKLSAEGVRQASNAVGGIGDIQMRVKVFETLAEAGFTCPTLIHPTAVVEPSASLAKGVQIFPLAYLGSATQVGFGVIVNTGAIISHDCQLGDYANISPGAILAGGVQVGTRALIGMGVTVNLGVRVGDGARVGNGATIKTDVPDGGLVRAGAVWPS